MALHKTQTLFIYNSISKKKEKFSPINKGAGRNVCFVDPLFYSNVQIWEIVEHFYLLIWFLGT